MHKIPRTHSLYKKGNKMSETLKPDQVEILNGGLVPIPGMQVIKDLGLDPEKCCIQVTENGNLSITQEGSSISYEAAPGFWRESDESSPEVTFIPKSPWQKEDCINQNGENPCPNESTIEAVCGNVRVRCCTNDSCKEKAKMIALMNHQQQSVS